MKFSLLTLLAFVGPTNVAAEAIEDRWKLGTPAMSYDENMNIFKLDFKDEASATNTLDGMKAYFYDRKCKFDYSSDFTVDNVNSVSNEYLITKAEGIVSVADDDANPAMQLDAITAFPYLEFQLKTDVLAKQSEIYDIIDQDIYDADVLASGDLISDDIGQGRMRMCVRTEIGYGDDFQTVNFIETLITVRYVLTAGFEVESFAVAPKVRVDVTAVKTSYALEAWLCDLAVSDTAPFETFPDTSPDAADNAVISVQGRGLPVAVATETYNQGALLTVCVAPTVQTYYDGIRLNGLTGFNWERDPPTPNTNNQPSVVQTAIADSQASILTAYNSDQCIEAEYCTFSSILFADFYRTAGDVTGEGDANLVFKQDRTRRLRGVEEGRQLQEDVGDSPFDLSVAVDVGAEGPGAIKTAGGSSYGFSALASAVALLSAALLA